MAAQGIADAVAALYRLKPGERAQLGQNGRKYFETHFESHKLTVELIDKFRSIAANKA